MGAIKINDYINLDIDDLDGTLEKVKHYGTLEELVQEFETRELIKVVFNNEILYLNRGYIQRFKISKKQTKKVGGKVRGYG